MMTILDPVSGRYVDLAPPPRMPARPEDRQTAKAAAAEAKEQLRAARYKAIRQAELDAGAL